MSRKTIAVLGASTDRGKYGNKCVRAYLHAGWDVYPVNAWSDTIEGLKVSQRLADVPVELDRISVYLPPPVTLEMVPEMAAKGAGEVWFNPGSADRQVVDAARAAGLTTVSACSIVDVGLRPSQFPD
jgi:predicted CoA-binding protein